MKERKKSAVELKETSKRWGRNLTGKQMVILEEKFDAVKTEGDVGGMGVSLRKKNRFTAKKTLLLSSALADSDQTRQRDGGSSIRK